MEHSAADFYTHFTSLFTKLAEGVDDIRAAYIIGSQARDNHPADGLSDMDILLFSSNPGYYLEQSEWLNKLGKVLCSFSTYTAGGDPERLTLFEGGYQVDFVVAHTNELEKLVAAKTVPGNFHRGVKVLIDKDSVSSRILPRDFHVPAVSPITEAAFSHVCQMFWFGTLYVAKQILREELWVPRHETMISKIFCYR